MHRNAKRTTALNRAILLSLAAYSRIAGDKNASGGGSTAASSGPAGSSGCSGLDLVCERASP